jgi:hypothetical protein
MERLETLPRKEGCLDVRAFSIQQLLGRKPTRRRKRKDPQKHTWSDLLHDLSIIDGDAQDLQGNWLPGTRSSIHVREASVRNRVVVQQFNVMR